MEAPPVGPLAYVPAAVQPAPLTPAQIAISNVSITEEPSRAKMRRVTQENKDVRIPAPFVCDETRQFNRYLDFIQKFPHLNDQLVALRTTPDEHAIRERIVFELVEADSLEEALHFYLEMQPNLERKEFLILYCQDLIKDEAKTKAHIEKIRLFQPNVFELFICELGCAYFDSNQIAHVNDIFIRLNSKKVCLLLYIINKFSAPFMANPEQTVHNLNQFPQPLKEEVFYLLGMILIRNQRVDLTNHFINFMTARKGTLLTLINNHNKK